MVGVRGLDAVTCRPFDPGDDLARYWCRWQNIRNKLKIQDKSKRKKKKGNSYKLYIFSGYVPLPNAWER